MIGFNQSIAAPLSLPNKPLFLATSVVPNVLFMIDDSGSMDWEIMSAKHWHFCDYDSNAPSVTGSDDCFGVIDNGKWRSRGNGQYRYFEYIYENDDNAYNSGCQPNEGTTIETCDNGLAYDWRVRNSDLNRIYYNPEHSYQPWLGPCLINGTPCSGATFTSARSDPREGSDGYNDLHDLGDASFPAVYDVWIDNAGFNTEDGRPRRGTNINATSTANTIVDLWDSHIRIQFNPNDIVVTRFEYGPDTSGINETTTVEATLNNSTACYNILGPNSLVRAVYAGTYAYNSTGEAGCRTIMQAKDNFANWYQYYRRRSFPTKAAIADLVREFPYFRFGLTVLNQHSSLFTEMPSVNITDFTHHNESLLDDFFAFDWPAQGTPLRRGLERAGKYYANDLNKTSPIVYSCQQNFTLLVTDGYWNGSAHSSVTPDCDLDGVERTLADVGCHYYNTDLSPLPNDVIPNDYDSATHQHMVTFSVGFGVEGLLNDTDGDGWPNPELTESGNWGNPFNSDIEKVDDLWHNAYNSKGTYVAAQSPKDLFSSIKEALHNIAARTGSVSSVAQSSRMLITDTRVYQAQFNTFDWGGHLLAHGFNTDHSLRTIPYWDAGCLLSGGICSNPIMTTTHNPGISSSARVILSQGNSNRTIAFQWPSDYTNPSVTSELTTDQIAALLVNAPHPVTTTNTAEIDANQQYGEDLINYLRGDQSLEEQNGGTMRNRKSIMGDLIYSTPVYVGAPNKFYPDSIDDDIPYSSFKENPTYRDRTPMVYVGSNDGMVHGFNATVGGNQEGDEMVAYVPGDLENYAKLPSLSSPQYDHLYFVDGSPYSGDAIVNGSWKTLLTGGYRSGGQGIYALDVSNPAGFSESNPGQVVLWEFTDADDPDLGLTFSRPQIARMHNDKWAIIFGNGYNNSVADGGSTTSTTGQAALFILFIENGTDGVWTINQDYIKLNVGPTDVNTPNGLNDIAVIDEDMDYYADYVYVGDLRGNMWKFDLTSVTPSNWSSELLFTAYHTTPGDQPITTQPLVDAHPNGLSYGKIIYFGTGKYLEQTDNTGQGQATQSFYAIWDKPNASTALRSQLLGQSISGEYTQMFDTDQDGTDDTTLKSRTTTNAPINWLTDRGWYLDLIVDNAPSNYGERIIVNPLLRNGKVILTTFLPSANPCDYGGKSWIMELDAASGGRLEESPFDFNEDGYFTVVDYINIGDTDNDGEDEFIPASGIFSAVGITATPTVLITEDKTKEIKVLSGTNGIGQFTENPGPYPKGRQNWRRLYK